MRGPSCSTAKHIKRTSDSHAERCVDSVSILGKPLFLTRRSHSNKKHVGLRFIDLPDHGIAVVEVSVVSADNLQSRMPLAQCLIGSMVSPRFGPQQEDLQSLDFRLRDQIKE